ncbi:SDR family NAD(P)-dependent oxidoreductase [Nocardia noduli]|uniref:SDR family NAD(P)-dependent oxidoreductase n=1 Tax=Nocardia noduli TaxID=2815722 RepID=UPI001C21E26A|nr:SDR family NAD(P)-dependent oxidoreductase [Nocardia noduli]
MGDRLKGRVAVVTGAGNGVGKACALSLAAEGARIVVNDLGTSAAGEGRSSAAADATVAEIRGVGGEAVANYDSVAEPQGCANLVQAAERAFGQVDIVLANAGAVMPGQIDVSDERYYKLMDLFLGQKFWLSRLTVPGMVERGYGRIVATASEGARGGVGNPLFAAAMGGTVSMMKGLATELRGTGVTANVLAPGASTRTYELMLPELERAHAEGRLSDEMWALAKKGPGPVEHVPPIVTWLCTSEAAEVSGRVFHAGGGRISVWSDYEDLNTISKGDPYENAPYSLDELDELVPGAVLG